MTDIYSKKKRSEIMSKISGKETKPEIIIRKYLFAQRFRYRKNDKRFPGKPDVVLPKYKTAIFVHGCFWHGHKNCKYSNLPVTNTVFWKNKISENIKRDKENIKKLKNIGWQVIVLWQCKLRNRKSREQALNNLTIKLNKLLDNKSKKTIDFCY